MNERCKYKHKYYFRQTKNVFIDDKHGERTIYVYECEFCKKIIYVDAETGKEYGKDD